MAKRLKTTCDVRRYLSGLINRTENKEVDVVLSGKLGYLCSVLLKAVEGSDLERRLEMLEGKIKNR